MAWINGLMHVIIEKTFTTMKFVEDTTEGFDELKKTVEKYTPEYVEEITGIPAEDLMRRPGLCQCQGRLVSYTAWASPSTPPERTM